MSIAPFAWDVKLPARGSQRPRATLSVSSESHGTEEYRVPVAVGKRLLTIHEGDGAAPSSRAELLYLLRETSLSCGRSRVEALLGRRDYSSAELADKLRTDGYPTSAVEELVERAVSCGLVDDARFGAAFARSKVASGWGRLKIERELERRGVRPDTIEGWPEDFVTSDDERERALLLASRRRVTGKNDYEKTVRFLCGRGFSFSLSAEVAREVLKERE